MAETGAQTDMGVGLGIAFSVVAVLAAIAMAGTAYLSALNHDEFLQLLSGVSVAIALLAGGLAIVAIHVFDR